jgi:hypothetical protein
MELLSRHGFKEFFEFASITIAGKLKIFCGKNYAVGKQCQSGLSERCSGKIVRLSRLWPRVRFPIPPVIEMATLSDSVGFLQGLRFPPTLHYKSPNIVYRHMALDSTQLYQ